MSSTEWDELSRRWRELPTQQAELAQSWFEGPRRTTPADGGDAGSAGIVAAMTELWRSWTELSGSLGRSWPLTTNAAGGGPPDPVWLSLLGGSHVGQAIRQMTEGPQFADVGTFERRTARLTELWLEVRAATSSYQQIVSEAWMFQSQRFGAALTERQPPGADALPAKEAIRLWLEIADKTLMETHRSEGFLTAQRRLLRAGTDFLLAERELVESIAAPAGFPTRKEIDEVHQSVQELKRRVRALEKGSLNPARRPPNADTTPDAAAMTQGDRP
jgi:hypothetical protein